MLYLFLFFFSHKDGYDKYTTWKKIWTSNGKTEPSPKAFMADQQLPYWVKKDNTLLFCKAFVERKAGEMDEKTNF